MSVAVPVPAIRTLDKRSDLNLPPAAGRWRCHHLARGAHSPASSWSSTATQCSCARP